jgi:hypothetical protein
MKNRLLSKLRNTWGSRRGPAVKQDPKSPFFIVGCVRSGTTMLRDILRHHPNLVCPEETHFFRWSDPFGTRRFENNYLNSKIIRGQQELDGISETEFNELLAESDSKKTLSERYAALYMEKQGKEKCRWFDKTPQNVYGMLLLSAVFPGAQFIHIHRNPLNVVASLLEGAVMPVHSLKGAINYWTEAMLIISEYKRAWPDRVLEVGYEDFTLNARDKLKDLLSFIQEDRISMNSILETVHQEANKYREKLTYEQIETVKRECEPFYTQYNYK